MESFQTITEKTCDSWLGRSCIVRAGILSELLVSRRLLDKTRGGHSNEKGKQTIRFIKERIFADWVEAKRK